MILSQQQELRLKSLQKRNKERRNFIYQQIFRKLTIINEENESTKLFNDSEFNTKVPSFNKTDYLTNYFDENTNFLNDIDDELEFYLNSNKTKYEKLFDETWRSTLSNIRLEKRRKSQKKTFKIQSHKDRCSSVESNKSLIESPIESLTPSLISYEECIQLNEEIKKFIQINNEENFDNNSYFFKEQDTKDQLKEDMNEYFKELYKTQTHFDFYDEELEGKNNLNDKDLETYFEQFQSNSKQNIKSDFSNLKKINIDEELNVYFKKLKNLI